jgi:hypothetical protein
MSEITKLYKNAGIKPERQDCCKIADKYWASNTESGFEYLMQKECPHNQECTDECEYAYDNVIYPQFTAEKQIDLIKWLAKKDYYTCDYCEIEPRKDGQEWLSYCHFKSWTSNTFENALAGLINEMWQDLTEEEKQQVKGILE